MPKYSDMLVFLRKRKGLSQQDLSKQIGISRSAIGMYETGKRVPDLETFEIFADFYNVDMNTLTGMHLTKSDITKAEYAPSPSVTLDKVAAPYHPTHQIPILGRISAGLPIYAEQHIEGYTFTDLNHGGEYFALRVHGDSMNAAHIFNGDLLIVRRQSCVDDGDIAVVLVGGEDATVKRFYHTGDTVTLMPQSTNPSYLPQIYNVRETPVLVLGKAVESKVTLE